MKKLLLSLFAFVAVDCFGAIGGSVGGISINFVENAGSTVTQRNILNFQGTGVSVADNQVSSRTDVTISGGSGSSSLAVSQNGVVVSSPTKVIDFRGGASVILTGGATAQVTINAGDVFLASTQTFSGQEFFQSASPSTFTYLNVSTLTLPNQVNNGILYMNGPSVTSTTSFTFNGSTMNVNAITTKNLIVSTIQITAQLRDYSGNPGPIGYVFTSNGGGLPPSWQATQSTTGLITTINAGSGISVVNSTGPIVTISATGGGGGGSPGLPFNSLQINGGGVFIGTAALTMNTTSNLLSIGATTQFTSVSTTQWTNVSTVTFGNGSALAMSTSTSLQLPSGQVLTNSSSVTVQGVITAGSNITLTQTPGILTIASTGGGGGGTPGAPNNSIQINGGGVFIGTAALTMNTTSNLLTIGATTQFTSVSTTSWTNVSTVTFGNGSALVMSTSTNLQLPSGQVLANGSSVTVQGVITAGSNITLTPTAGVLTIASTGGGSTNSSGSNGAVQISSNSGFGSDASFNYSTTTKSLSVTTVTATNGVFSSSVTAQTLLISTSPVGMAFIGYKSSDGTYRGMFALGSGDIALGTPVNQTAYLDMTGSQSQFNNGLVINGNNSGQALELEDAKIYVFQTESNVINYLSQNNTNSNQWSAFSGIQVSTLTNRARFNIGTGNVNDTSPTQTPYFSMDISSFGTTIGYVGLNTTSSVSGLQVNGEGGITISSNSSSGNVSYSVATTRLLVSTATEIDGTFYVVTSSTQPSLITSGLIVSGGAAVLQGISTGTLATQGNYGEKISSSAFTAVNLPATTTWGDLVSVALTTGAWSVTLQECEQANGATITSGGYIAISTTSGNNGGGLNYPDNEIELPLATTTDGCGTISSYLLNLSANQTIYGKMQDVYSVGQPKMLGVIRAIRAY